MGQLGTPELLIVLAVIAIVTGGKRLPGVAANLGKAVRELRTSLQAPELPTRTHDERNVSPDRPSATNGDASPDVATDGPGTPVL